MIETPEGLELPEDSPLHPQGHEWEREFIEDHGDIMTARYVCQVDACSALCQGIVAEQAGLDTYV
ncbi:hypothetical protein C449_00620 [Halococcus saccharolyticus DSM 5350]|uniref:Uncharacterized protein n=1 Tax=Halococcus saccharolyticus DSM 5350 TaxID=1227455 RepID=M0MTZ6_9EURY|nr:hypothetical protein C449_00620 [Halococcus saccharolyticus DSM 5350]